MLESESHLMDYRSTLDKVLLNILVKIEFIIQIFPGFFSHSYLLDKMIYIEIINKVQPYRLKTNFFYWTNLKRNIPSHL
jgi:hypothetical protein